MSLYHFLLWHAIKVLTRITRIVKVSTHKKLTPILTLDIPSINPTLPMTDPTTEPKYLACIHYLGFEANPDRTPTHFQPGDQVKVLDYYMINVTPDSALPRRQVSKWWNATVVRVNPGQITSSELSDCILTCADKVLVHFEECDSELDRDCDRELDRDCDRELDRDCDRELDRDCDRESHRWLNLGNTKDRNSIIVRNIPDYWLKTNPELSKYYQTQTFDTPEDGLSNLHRAYRVETLIRL